MTPAPPPLPAMIQAPLPLPAPPRRASQVALGFLTVLIVCQLGLLFPSLAGLRVAWRMGAFLTSLALWLLVPGKTRRFAATVTALWVLALLALEIIVPTHNTWLSAIAEFAMSAAVLAPLFWVSRLYLDYRAFRLAILVLWLFYFASACFGLLQVAYPGRFQPAVSPVIEGMGAGIEGLKIYLPNGREIFRPLGLTDTPGGAGLAGMWTILLGLGLLFTERRWTLRALSVAGMVAGMMCIYLCQVRVQLVVVTVWIAALLALFLWRRMWRQLAITSGLVGAIVAASIVLTLSVGGQGIFARYATLTSAPTKTYATSRGEFLQRTIHNDLPEYPLGAGMGRWGMMSYYFGSDHVPADRSRLYVEIQFTGWVLDGGAPLVALYLTMIGLAMAAAYRIARRPGPLRYWAVILLAFDIGMVAMSFDYTPFTGDSGLEFWFLNALVLTTGACLRWMPPAGVGAWAPERAPLDART